MRKIQLFNYDIMIDKTKGLKQLEGFMGNDIRETSVNFNIERKLIVLFSKKHDKHDIFIRTHSFTGYRKIKLS